MVMITTEVYFDAPTQHWCNGPLAASDDGQYYVRATWLALDLEGPEFGELHVWVQVAFDDWLAIRDREFVEHLIEARIVSELPGTDFPVEVLLDPNEGREDDAASVGHLEGAVDGGRAIAALRQR